jgi:hypothetical protein
VPPPAKQQSRCTVYFQSIEFFDLFKENFNEISLQGGVTLALNM